MMPLSMRCVNRTAFLARKRISRPFFRYLASDNNSSNEWDESNKEKLDLSQYSAENIRNFCIIAHVDHGKSTLADRILEMTGTISKNTKNEQVLDRLQVERERGITVKAQNVCIFHKHYLLNLIDTPGHVDFNYEVSRSLASCQGAILLVDANQGVQAQTMANFFLAFESNLAIIPVLNKIDLKNAKPEAVAAQMAQMLEFNPNDILKISAKFGTGVDKLLDAVIEKVPPPTGDPGKPLKALVFDSWFDRYKGAIMNVAINEGSISVGDKITSFHTKKSYTVKHLGVMRPDTTPVDKLSAGQVGYVIANMRSTSEAQVGDTLHHFEMPVIPLPGFKAAKPMVYAGIFPTDQSQTSSLRSAIDKLILNDSSVSVQLETSAALGQGWRLGFLGLLHMDVFNQRLEQEHDAQVVLTAPSVPYKVKIKGEKNIKLHKTDMITINNPVHLPDPNTVENYFEPWVISTIITPERYMGQILGLCMGRRGKQLDSRNLDQCHLMLKFKLPLNEIVVDFYDILKSISSGYASFDYEESGYEPSDLVKVTYMLNGNPVEELTSVAHVSRARTFGHHVCKRLKDTLPQHLFDIAIQAAVGGKIIARETIKAAKKNVTAKCYGGDITRKMKLLKRQAEGKKQMRMVGNIEVPRDAFIKVLKQETS